MPKYPSILQLDQMDCAPTCLKMIARYYGKEYPLEYFRETCYLNKQGVSLINISDAAKSIGLNTLMTNASLEVLKKNSFLPAILHWNKDHFVVLYKYKKNDSFIVSDPAHGLITLDSSSFQKGWLNSSKKGFALFLEPTRQFWESNAETPAKKANRFIFNYLFSYKKYISQIILGMVLCSLISLAFPFLTQIIVDKGVGNRNLNIVYVFLLSQLILFSGETAIKIIRSWLLLHISARISLTIVSDFLIKLLKLPIKYFDSKSVGDISQRINDHHKIENFLTGATLSSLFSLFNILIFSCVLALYNFLILLVFLASSLLAIGWIFLFQKQRKKLDYTRFARNKEHQDKLFEMVTGMQDIKLYGSEEIKREEWEQLQLQYFDLNIKSLSLEQYQYSGYIFISHLKNIFVSFISAREVINGNITLGTMLSISYIIGQTNSPIEQFVSFIKNWQDAKLSMERLHEIHYKKDEENLSSYQSSMRNDFHDDIHFSEVSFQYEGPNSACVLKEISLTIPKGKTTAIVGTSGSGKSTLLKLLLGFYSPVKGGIFIGQDSMEKISPKFWRMQCGAVMQDGHIFNDTIARNIAFDSNEINESLMKAAARIANIQEFIESLPLGFSTKIGNSGIGLSGGQKQRILIARAIYKNPKYIFLDEATSNLDTNNEREINENLHVIFEGKTVVVIAHRLSTVKNADQIVVMEKGEIVEIGTHTMLVTKKGKYFELVKNQLELER